MTKAIAVINFITLALLVYLVWHGPSCANELEPTLKWGPVNIIPSAPVPAIDLSVDFGGRALANEHPVDLTPYNSTAIGGNPVAITIPGPKKNCRQGWTLVTVWANGGSAQVFKCVAVGDLRDPE